MVALLKGGLHMTIVVKKVPKCLRGIVKLLFGGRCFFMSKKQKQTHPEVGEDVTQFGEFVSSYFAWVPLPEQKEKADEMAKMTKKEKKQ